MAAASTDQNFTEELGAIEQCTFIPLSAATLSLTIRVPSVVRGREDCGAVLPPSAFHPDSNSVLFIRAPTHVAGRPTIGYPIPQPKLGSRLCRTNGQDVFFQIPLGRRWERVHWISQPYPSTRWTIPQPRRRSTSQDEAESHFCSRYPSAT